MQCRYCKFEIPEDATVCGHCHAVVISDGMLKFQKWIVIVGVSVVIVSIFVIAIASAFH
jgi:hypothetical protein